MITLLFVLATAALWLVWFRFMAKDFRTNRLDDLDNHELATLAVLASLAALATGGLVIMLVFLLNWAVVPLVLAGLALYAFRAKVFAVLRKLEGA